jgi:iron complex outermembrane receptor protein
MLLLMLPMVHSFQAHAETGAGSTVTLDRVIAETPRLRGVSAFDTPASLDVIDLRDESAAAGTNLSERLSQVPGLLARDR